MKHHKEDVLRYFSSIKHSSFVQQMFGLRKAHFLQAKNFIINSNMDTETNLALVRTFSPSHVPVYHYCTVLLLCCYVKCSIPGVSQVRHIN